MENPSNPLADALAKLGRDEATRNAFLAVLRDWETANRRLGRDVREDVLAPVTDALFHDVDALSRELASGLVFTMPYRSKIAREFALGQEPLDHVWEPQTTRVLLRLAQSARAVLIGGAYSGDHAILIAHAMAGAGDVLCFEPNAEQRSALLANASANGLTNLTVSADGLWGTPAYLRLEGSDSHAHPVECAADDPDGFRTTTIEEAGAKAGLSQLDLILLDIEGGEVNALRGADRFLAQPPETAPDLVFEIHGAYTDWSAGLAGTDVLELVHSYGYRSFAIRDYQGNVGMAGQPVELVPTDEAYLSGPPHGFNLLASKRPDIVQRLDARLVRNVSPKLLFHRDTALHQPLAD